MNDNSKLETEELLTCLHIHLYHRNQARCPLFQNLPLNQPYKMDAEDPLRLGRDGQTCIFVLNDTSVSRKQLSIQAYRKAGSTFLSFTIQNMSQKVKLVVGGSELGYLERAELVDKVLLRFGRYEMLIWPEPGDSANSFEVLFETCNTPPSQELGIDVPCKLPVMDTGVSWKNLENGAPVSQEPLESDETVFSV
ncbi:TRAF-interacting protein with FHA domain-containing protein A [Chanodichthys erythropterus]|uniref:TRAF-interacting protein with FHA domain-containing protein A n=1 Tax=Chanodichthys erythropterus TaxID=933992 RepID=UPI00351EB4E1